MITPGQVISAFVATGALGAARPVPVIIARELGVICHTVVECMTLAGDVVGVLMLGALSI
jgi:hypothetical protein